MSLYDGIIAKNNDNESDSQQVPHESKRPLSLYGDLLPSSAVIEQEPVTYKPQDKIANVSNSLRFKPTRRNRGNKAERVAAKRARIGPVVSNGSKAPAVSTVESNQNIYQEYKQYRDPELKYWDETYDSMQPNKLINYENSQEFLMELDDWKDYLLHLNENSVLEFVEAEDKDMREKEIEEKDDKDEEYEDEDEDENEIIFEEYPDFAGKSKSMVPDNDRTSIKKTNNMGQRLLQKYGWKPGTGLGRESSGITKPLKFSMSRRRPGMGRIVDKNEKKRSKFGDSSRVIKIIGMISSDGESQNLDMPSKLSKTFEKVFWVVSKIYIYLYSFCLVLISLARF